MSLSDMIIMDYGTFSIWGAILSGGEVVTSQHTNARGPADYFGWTYLENTPWYEQLLNI